MTLFIHIRLSVFLEKESKIALGGWGGNTRWGKLIIEGEIIKPQQEPPVPSDVINIQSNGASFAPVIEVVGVPLLNGYLMIQQQARLPLRKRLRQPGITS
jgi:hypothetical protein